MIQYPSYKPPYKEPAIEDEIEEALFKIFDELDAVILESLPDSLLISPAELIRQTIVSKYGISLEISDIIDCYLRYESITSAGYVEEDFYTLGGVRYG